MSLIPRRRGPTPERKRRLPTRRAWAYAPTGSAARSLRVIVGGVSLGGAKPRGGGRRWSVGRLRRGWEFHGGETVIHQAAACRLEFRRGEERGPLGLERQEFHRQVGAVAIPERGEGLVDGAEAEEFLGGGEGSARVDEFAHARRLVALLAAGAHQQLEKGTRKPGFQWRCHPTPVVAMWARGRLREFIGRCGGGLERGVRRQKQGAA